MKANQQDAVSRLRALYNKEGENQIFARMLVNVPAELTDGLERRAEKISAEVLPSLEQLFPLWDEYLGFFEKIEDDWVPAIYPHQYDQGIYGTLFGSEMHVNRAGTPGWFCSSSYPVEDKSYAELLLLASAPKEDWVLRMESDLRRLSAMSEGKWGIAVPITIDAFNLCQQIRGTQTFMDIYDHPEELKSFLQAAVQININLVERHRAAINSMYDGGVYDLFNGGWMPENSIPMSVDCYNMCHAEIYAEFGLPYQQQLVDHFGGGNFHIHGNGLHLLPEVGKLKGYVASWIGNDGSAVPALDNLDHIKKNAGNITPFVPCETDQFVRKLGEKSLIGGIHYTVGPVETVDEANRLMESVRRYRV